MPEDNPLVRLRGTVINPDPSQAVQNLQTRVGAGSTGLPQFQGVAAGSEQLTPFKGVEGGSPLIQAYGGAGADVRSLRGTLNTQAQGLAQGPSRADLAADAFDILRRRSEPEYQRRLRDVGTRAAALGRIGAGMTTTELGDVASLRNRDLLLAQESLANTAAQQELADRLGIFSAIGGLQNQLFGQDLASDRASLSRELAQSQEQRGLRDERRGERASQRDFDIQDVSLARSLRDEERGERSALEQALFDRYAIDTTALSQLEGIEAGRRQEQRGERERADILAEIANDRRIQQVQQEAALQQQLFNQLMQRGLAAGELGFGGITPLNAIPGLADEASAQGGQFSDSGMQALMNFFMNRSYQPPSERSYNPDVYTLAGY